VGVIDNYCTELLSTPSPATTVCVYKGIVLSNVLLASRYNNLVGVCLTESDVTSQYQVDVENKGIKRVSVVFAFSILLMVALCILVEAHVIATGLLILFHFEIISTEAKRS
jgi:hypothetical protein